MPSFVLSVEYSQAARRTSDAAKTHKILNVSVAVMKPRKRTFKEKSTLAQLTAARRHGTMKYTPVLKCGRKLLSEFDFEFVGYMYVRRLSEI